MKKRKTEFYSLLFQEEKDDLGRFVHRSKYLILDKNAADPSVLPKLRAKFDFVNKYIWLFIVVLGSLLLLVYDYVMMKAQHWINVLVYKIKK